MSKTEETKRILSEMTIPDAIFRCGTLQIPLDEVALLLSLTPLSLAEGQWREIYLQGIAEGNLKLSMDLVANISEPKAKDAYKHLSAERRRQAINKKLEEFFL